MKVYTLFVVPISLVILSLVVKCGGNQPHTFVSVREVVFDDSATTTIADPSNISSFTGTYKPEQLLSAFNSFFNFFIFFECGFNN
jgi:hypothetical protein